MEKDRTKEIVHKALDQLHHSIMLRADSIVVCNEVVCNQQLYTREQVGLLLFGEYQKVFKELRNTEKVLKEMLDVLGSDVLENLVE